MTMILTPARTLVSAKARCSISSLECQVYGTRVCIDNSNACDGVPNCGAYEVYDEDRLMCGAAIGLQHNVYLAAITFIAVLLTILYIIHYWLKRCVPKVSEAFFIYMDGAENILYLETIMRSPFDVGAGPRAIYRRSLCNNNDDTYLDDTEKFRFNIFSRLWKACFNFVTCKFKSKKDVSSLELNVPDDFYKESKRIYSSTEFELTRISNREVKNTSVQTGDSLEISGNKNEETGTKQKLPNQGKQYSQRVAHHDISFSTEDTVKKHVDELNILKFFKDSKFQDSLELNSQDTVRVSMNSAESHIVEEEIEMHLYDLDNNKRRKQKDKLSEHKTHAIKSSFDAIKSSKEVGPVKQEVSKRHTKHLRFVEEAVAIPNHEEDDILQSPSVIKDKKWQTNEDNVDNDGAIAGTSRDFKRFWSGITKKSKKKTQVSLH